MGHLSPEMACPQLADGREGLQIRRVVANTLNNRSRTADRGGPVAWGLGGQLTLLRSVI